MEPVTTAALIAGGTALIGGYMGNQANAANTAAANAQSFENAKMAARFNQQTAREQMGFQERMSNTAYQRSMEDMRKAGLNPMLAYQQGGASAPSGAAGTMTAPTAQAAEYKDPFAPAIASAMNAYQTSNQTLQGAANVKVNQANSVAEIGLKAAQTNATVQSAKNAAIQAKLLEAQIAKAKAESKWYDSDLGKQLYELNQINNTVGGVLDSANTATSIVNPFKGLKDLLNKQKKGGKIIEKFNPNTGEIEKWLP